MTSPHHRHRRLSGRRGSVSAGDPWALHMTPIDDTATTSSRITIVRVPSNSGDSERNHRRSSSGASGHSSSGSAISGRSSPGARLSFAFSSFTPIHPASAPPTATLPSSSTAPTSPGMFKRSNSSGSIHRMQTMQLPPNQLIDIAAAAVHPSSVAESGMRECPDEVLLPFLDRAEEVSALLRTPPTSKLFALLQALFINETSSPRSSGPVPPPSPDSDPLTWSFAQLSAYMTKTPRDVQSDEEWVYCVRTCVRNKSEALWERFKGALGVPPELEDDDVFLGDDEDDEFHGEGAEDGTHSSSHEGSPSKQAEKEEQPEVRLDGEVFIEPLYATQDSTSHFVLSPAGMSPTESTHPLHFGYGGPEGGMPNIGEREEEIAEKGEESKKEDEEPQQIQAIQIHATAALRSPSIPTHPPSRPSSRPSSAMSFSGPSPKLGARALSSSFHPGFERGPGNPLFPSSFAGLNLGPTIVANNLALRNQVSPHGTTPRRNTHHGHGFKRRPSWGDVYRSKYEYAVTAASASSDGGRG